MARHRRGQDKPIELFPFLAILACVIGVLTLVIAGLSLGELEIDMSGVEFARLQGERVQDLQMIEGIERKGEGVRIRHAQVKHLRREILQREEDAVKAERLQQELAELQTRHDQALATRNELQGGIERLQRELASVEGELRGVRQKLRDRVVEVQGPRARSGQRRLRPRFVECRTHEAVLDPDRPVSSRCTVMADMLDTSAEYRRLWRDIQRTSGGIVIFLVREGGVDTYRAAIEELEDPKVQYGALPVPSARRIDFSKLTSGR